MYPLIQTHVWAKIGGEHGLLKMVLDSFIKVCVCVCVWGGGGGHVGDVFGCRLGEGARDGRDREGSMLWATRRWGKRGRYA